jgi:hypothetical protein
MHILEDAPEIVTLVKPEIAHPVGKLSMFDLKLPSRFAKAIYLHIRNQYKRWSYDEKIDSWDAKKVNKALCDYKKTMLYITMSVALGSAEKVGLFKSLKILHLFDFYTAVKKIKNEAMSSVPENIKDLIGQYMVYVWPIEKRVISAFDENGCISETGFFQDGEKIIGWLSNAKVKEYMNLDKGKK